MPERDLSSDIIRMSYKKRDIIEEPLFIILLEILSLMRHLQKLSNDGSYDVIYQSHTLRVKKYQYIAEEI